MICGSVNTSGAAHLNIGLHLLLNAIFTPSNTKIDHAAMEFDDIENSEMVAELALAATQDPIATCSSEDSYLHQGIAEKTSSDGTRKLCAPLTSYSVALQQS